MTDISGFEPRREVSVIPGITRYSVLITVMAVSLVRNGEWIAAQEACAAQPATYISNGLKITGALMKPSGRGPFPVVIYNHGARTGRERQPQLPVGTLCLSFVLERRWVYFVPDRRGFGHSQGPSLRSVEKVAETRNLSDAQLVAAFRARIREEANDVLAGLEFLRTLPFVDLRRVGVIGYSWGALVTLRAASGAPSAFKALLLQAGGAPEGAPFYEGQLREMVDMGRLIDAPILIQNGTDDRESSVMFSRQLGAELRRLGKDVTVEVYKGTHDLFATYPRGPEGDWGRDVLSFLARHLR